MPWPPESVGKGCLSGAFFRSSGQLLSPRYVVNALNNFDKTVREYSLACTDDVIRFWGSKVKVTAGRLGGEYRTYCRSHWASGICLAHATASGIRGADLQTCNSPEPQREGGEEQAVR